MDIGPTELIIILVIVVLLFGVGRIGKIASELGSGIRTFRENLQGTADTEDKKTPGEAKVVSTELTQPEKKEQPS